MRNLKSCLLISVVILFANALFGQNSLLQEEFSDPDFTTPENIETHVFNFFHHSCGGNLLSDSLAAWLQDRGYSLHSRIHTQYEYENNYTDYRHWYKRFQRELGIKSGDHYYRYEGPDQNGDPVLGEQIDDDYRDFMLNYYEYNAELMDIIMFKPCYPGSQISNYDTQYDGLGTNNGFGNVTGGTPYSDNGNVNFTYLNSSTSVESDYSTTYWSNGYWSGAGSSLAQLKCAYRGMLNIFVRHPDILFIAMQAPPMVWLSDDAASNCREFARWLREDWLHQYDPHGTDSFEDYPLKNVVPFDFHNTIAWTSDDPLLDNEYFWFVQGGMPDNSMDTEIVANVGRSASTEDHPDSWLNIRTATIFCGGTDNNSTYQTGNPVRTYDCWINAVVNRWEKSLQPVPVELIGLICEQVENDVTVQWSTATESNNFGFEVQRRKNGDSDFTKIGFVRGSGTTVIEHDYLFVDKNVMSGHYDYRLKQIDFDGSFEYSFPVEILVNFPHQFELVQNYPNPFNARTNIIYQLPKRAVVNITIYDVLGRRIKQLLNNEQNEGEHRIVWDGLNEIGTPVNSGVYFFQIYVDGEVTEMKKMILLK